MEEEEGWGNKHKTNTDTGAEAKAAEGKGKRQLEKERIPGREQPSCSYLSYTDAGHKVEEPVYLRGHCPKRGSTTTGGSFCQFFFDFSGM